MKKQLILFLIVIKSFYVNASAHKGDFRTLTDGEWRKNSTWEIFDGKKWVDAFTSPTNLDGEISVRNGTNISISENLNIDQLIVEEGGHLWIDQDKVLNVINGKGTDLFINGTLCVNGILNESEKSNMAIAGLVLIQHEGSHEFCPGSTLTILNDGKIRYGEIGSNELAYTDPNNKQPLIKLSPGVFNDMHISDSQKNNSMQSLGFLSENVPDGVYKENENSSSKFENFNTTVESDKISLSWNMEFNSENQNCRIERSRDGINFYEIICAINPGKNMDQYYFTAIDEHPNQGENYYRIKQISREYNKFYSEVLTVNFDYSINIDKDIKIISLVRNPITKNYELVFFVPHGGMIDLALLNSSGRRIFYEKISVPDGFNSYEFFRPLTTKRNVSFATLSRNDEMVLEKILKD